MTEVLKNSFRATVEHQRKVQHSNQATLPPVVVTISPPSLVPSVDGSESHTYLSIRIRDQGGGVLPANMARIFSYAFTTAGRDIDDDGGGPYAAQHVGGSAAISDDDSMGGANLFGEITGKGLQTGMGTIAGLGYGLPMSKLYARLASNICTHILY